MKPYVKRPNPEEVLERFRLGQDTAAIANIFGLPEHIISRLLESALDLESAKREQAACDAWNASLRPAEQKA